jgi:hypothetical protein
MRRGEGEWWKLGEIYTLLADIQVQRRPPFTVAFYAYRGLLLKKSWVATFEGYLKGHVGG